MNSMNRIRITAEVVSVPFSSNTLGNGTIVLLPMLCTVDRYLDRMSLYWSVTKRYRDRQSEFFVKQFLDVMVVAAKSVVAIVSFNKFKILINIIIMVSIFQKLISSLKSESQHVSSGFHDSSEYSS